MSFSLFSVIIIILFATIAAIEIYRGVTRGFSRALLALGSLLLSVVASLLFAPGLSGLIVGLVFKYAVRPMQAYQNLIKSYQSFDPIIEAIASALVSTLLFTLLFFLIRILLSLIVSAISRKLMTPKANDPGYCRAKKSFCYRHDRLLGGIAGGLCAVIVTMALTTPFLGALNIAGKAIDMAERGDSQIWKKAGIPVEEVETFRSYTQDLPANLLYELGGKYMYHTVAKTQIYGETAYVLNELKTIEIAFEEFLDVYGVLQSPKNATPEHLEKLKNIEAQVNELHLCHGVLAEYLSDCANAWLDGYKYFKIRKPYVHKSIEPVLDEVLVVCAETDHKSVKQNLSTLLNMYIIILDSGIADVKSNDFKALIECLEQSDAIARLDAELDKNPYMEGISVSGIAMKALADKIDATPYKEEDYTILMENLAEAVNAVQSRGYGSTEEKVTVLTSYAQQYIDTFGIQISPVIAESAATEILNSLDYGDGEITAEQIESLFNEFLN